MTTTNNQWLLPEGIEELLPARAQHFEMLRRGLLDLYDSWGYDLVMPPFIEYIDSLLPGIGKDLSAQTFKLPDHLSGKMLGVRADMTPQVARIDARSQPHDGPARLCYMGTVLHANTNGFAGSRSALQVGTELFGHFGPSSDAEVITLMLETIQFTGITHLHIDIGHVGIFRSLAQQAKLTTQQESTLFNAMQRKAAPEINQLLTLLSLPEKQRDMLSCLVNLYGDQSILEVARQSLAAAPKAVHDAIDYLQQLAELLRLQTPNLQLYFDLAELRGYQFHTGVVYAAFTTNYGQEIARGGRYDNFGSVFGKGRPATGFNTDLKTLVGLAAQIPANTQPVILAPDDYEPDLKAYIMQLRQNKQRVINALPNQIPPSNCTQKIDKIDGQWQIVPL